MRYRSDIDGLRAVAVLSVVIFHANPEALPGGFVGVDMFFAISGFLISGILWEQFRGDSFSFLAFYARRSRRLLPALYVTLACTVLTALALFPVEEVRETAWSAIAAVGSLSNIRFARQSGYFDDSAYRKSLLHTWSLGVEEQFYLVWPVALQLLYAYRHRISATYAVPAVVALVGLSEVATRITPSQAYFLVPFRFYQFLIGAAVHLLPPLSSRALQEVFSIAGALATALALYLFSGNTPFPGLMALLPTVGTAALLYTGQSTLAHALSIQPLTTIGRISYSVYLVHWPMVVAYTLLSSTRDIMLDEVLFLIVGSLVLGYSLHHSVESRFRHSNPGEEDASGNIRKPPEWHSLLLYASLGVALCISTYLCIELAEMKKESLVGSIQGASSSIGSQNNTIPELDLASVKTWEKRLCSPANWNWRPSIRGSATIKKSTANKRALHLTYMPKSGKPKARMLLYGDSHAETLKPMVLRLAMEKGFYLDSFTMPACVALLTLGEEIGKDRSRYCKAEQKYWQAKMEKQPYDFIVVATRWTMLYEDERYGNYTIQRTKIFNRHGEAPPDTAVLRERFKQSLKDTLRIVLNTGASVIAVAQVPHVGKSVRGCLQLPKSKKELLKGIHPTACLGATRRDVLRRSKYMNDLFLKLDYENKRLRSLTTIKYFCDNFEEDYCRSIYAGTELYVDDSHLSSFGSMLLAERLVENSYEGVDFSFRNPKARFVVYST